MWFWHPMKEEIKNWVEVREKEFVEQEHRNPRLLIESQLQRYIFSNIHEIFFATFLGELHTWLSWLAKNKTFNHNDRPIRWNLELIQKLKQTDNPVSRAIDFWLNNVFKGFMTEFTVDTLKAYSEAERIFFKGYHSKYLNSLNLWIKMLLCENRVLKLESQISRKW